MTVEVEKWGLFEAAFPGPKGGNPFVEVTLDADFGRENRRVRAPGFHDGDDVYRIRFMPDTEGEWTYRTRECQSSRWPKRNVSLRPARQGQPRPGPRAQPPSLRLCRRKALFPFRDDLLRLDPC
jgi:hypothetical protein